MTLFADDNNGVHSLSGGTIPWDAANPDATTNSWKRQIIRYEQNTNVHRCPANRWLPPAPPGRAETSNFKIQ